jgi:hypothetical protein
MKLSDQAIKKLKQYLREDYPDVIFSEEKVQEIAANLVRTVLILYK